ncbi:MAG TPA: MBL fold metallo-hydrolase [Chloroflexota bacterium]|nr:MBL fold metallo-hydrolase [Chloroflexota bacterium]
MTPGEPGWPWKHGRALLDEIAANRPPPGSLALWHIGQSGFVVKGSGTTLYFDPFLSPSSGRLQRTWEPPFAPQDVTDAEVVFCSHSHRDHLDPPSVRGIAGASPQARFVAPPAAVPQLLDLGMAPERALAAAVGEPQTVGQVTVHAVPAAHGDKVDPLAECVWEPDPQLGYRYVGFVVECNGVRLYHAGDTTIYPGMVERLSALDVDLALVPINGRDWFREQRGIIGNADAREAADLGHAIGADVVVPMHYDMFATNPGSPAHFVEYCLATYPGQGFHVPERCKRWIYVK